MVGTVLVALGVTGFFSVRRRVLAAQLDEDAVVVLPFRVAGDASLAVMREGMVDLMSAKLTGEGGARAIDSRTALSAWKREVDSPDDDLTPDEGIRLARSLGAAQVLLGEVVAAPGNIVINATLHSALARPVRVQESAPADSLLGLVDRVVARLLSEQAGEAHRAEALLSESLTAVKAYLDGQRLYRRGSYNDAVARYKAALEEDSTFALAAFGLARARAWAGFGADFIRGQELAFTFRDRMPARDRDFLLAWVGADYPAPRAAGDAIRAWESLVQAAPDRIEAWYELGDAYFHNGTAAGFEDAAARALDAWTRAAALDSAFAPAIEHQVELFADRGDTAQVRRVADFLFTRVQPDLKNSSRVALVAATSLRDEAWLAELRPRIPSWPRSDITEAALLIELRLLPQTDLDTLHAIIFDLSTQAQKFGALFNRSIAELNRGKPAVSARTLAAAAEVGAPYAAEGFGVALATVFAEADSAATATQLARLEPFAYGDTPADPAAVQAHMTARCFVELWRVTRGQLETAASAVEKLHAWYADKPHDTTVRPCSFAIDALRNAQMQAPDARAAIAQLDSVLLNTPVQAGWRDHYVMVSARAWQQIGDLEHARTAVLRHSSDNRYPRAQILLEHARIAARLGRRDEAITAYERYLRMRPDPEPGKAAEVVAQAKSELAALVGEARR